MDYLPCRAAIPCLTGQRQMWPFAEFSRYGHVFVGPGLTKTQSSLTNQPMGHNGALPSCRHAKLRGHSVVRSRASLLTSSGMLYQTLPQVAADSSGSRQRGKAKWDAGADGVSLRAATRRGHSGSKGEAVTTAPGRPPKRQAQPYSRKHQERRAGGKEETQRGSTVGLEKHSTQKTPAGATRRQSGPRLGKTAFLASELAGESAF